jgi:hypothetical protein
MNDPYAFIYKCDEDNTYVIVKAVDKETANESISKITDKKLRLKTIYEKWTFVDTTIMSVEEKDNMNETKTEIARWKEVRSKASALLKSRDECSMPECLKKEAESIRTFLKNADVKINGSEASLGVDRKPFVPYNPHNL